MDSKKNMVEPRQLSIVRYVCSELADATGIYNRLADGKVAKVEPPPEAVVFEDAQRLAGIRNAFGSSTASILRAAEQQLVTWEDAVLASQHAGGFVLPLQLGPFDDVQLDLRRALTAG